MQLRMGLGQPEPLLGAGRGLEMHIAWENGGISKEWSQRAAGRARSQPGVFGGGTGWEGSKTPVRD